MTLEELIQTLRMAAVNENTITAMTNAYNLGFEAGQQRKPLTHDQRVAVAAAWRDGNGTASEIIDMVEIAHGIKE